MKTICMKTNEEITSYEPENFEENYKAYLVGLLSTDYECVMSGKAAQKEKNRIDDILKERGVVCNNIYIDPDGKENIDFYRDLSNFLNAASWKNKKKLYFKANEHKPDKNIDGMITVYKDIKCDEYYFTLQSDQLGFSAVPWIYFSTKYPLSRYFEMQKNEEAAKFLTDYVLATRTLGGSFLWPETLHEQYNKYRGIGNYIEDRVDLTLFEIKHIYEIRKWEKLLPYGGDILFQSCKNNDAQTWFGFFKSFEDYVDFFEFNDFVENISKTSKKEYIPINILTGKAFETDYPRRQTNVLKEIEDEKQLKEMLERVMDMVAKRTKKMEDLINEYKQTNDTKGETNENILHE